MNVQDFLARLDAIADQLLDKRNEIAREYLEIHSKPPFPPTAERDEQLKAEALTRLYKLYREAERLHTAVLGIHTDLRRAAMDNN